MRFFQQKIDTGVLISNYIAKARVQFYVTTFSVIGFFIQRYNHIELLEVVI